MPPGHPSQISPNATKCGQISQMRTGRPAFSWNEQYPSPMSICSQNETLIRPAPAPPPLSLSLSVNIFFFFFFKTSGRGRGPGPIPRVPYCSSHENPVFASVICGIWEHLAAFAAICGQCGHSANADNRCHLGRVIVDPGRTYVYTPTVGTNRPQSARAKSQRPPDSTRGQEFQANV